jgi:hypothetical protein
MYQEEEQHFIFPLASATRGNLKSGTTKPHRLK